MPTSWCEYFGPLQRAPQNIARIADVWVAARNLDVADHASRRRILRAPGDDLERRGVGGGDHIRLLDVLVARDRGPVETHTIVQGVL
jgi:hypothetical protein